MIRDLMKLIRDIYGDGEIKLHPAQITEEDHFRVGEAMNNRVDCYGFHVKEFEDALADYTRSKHVIATCSGTAALFAIFQCLDHLEHFPLFHTSNYGFRATKNPLDFLYEDQVLDYADIDEKLHMSKVFRHGVIIPVHLFGNFCEFISPHGLVIEDACQALGTFWNGKHAGTCGIAGALSFNGNKIITAGGGGAVLTEDDGLAESIRGFIARGFNLRMPALNAALGLSQLERIEKIVFTKREIAYAYQELFKDTEIRFLKEAPGTRSNYWLSTIVLPTSKMRDDWFDILEDSGIETRKGFQALNPEARTPAVYEYEGRVLCLPSGIPG